MLLSAWQVPWPLSLAACGGSGDSTADTASTAESTASSTEATAESTGSGDEAVTLNWALWDKDSTAYWQALADGYMESHPNVTIEMTDLGSTDYMTQLATQLAAATVSWTFCPSRTSPATPT